MVSVSEKSEIIINIDPVYFPEDYCPTEDEPYMNPRQLQYFRQKLVSWRQQILKESDETLNQIVEASVRESDAVDQGTLETYMALKLGARDRYRNLIQKIDDAIERIENGTYGYCEETGEEIGIKRLEARPIATLCIEAQQWRERKVNRRIAY